MLSALLGPYGGFLTMIAILLIQCLLFADGGLLALGCNIWNMAFYGCFVGGLIIWRSIMKNGMNKKKILAASVLGSVISLQLGAFSVTLETLASGITELPFGVFLTMMQPIHLAIGLVEGLITAAVLIFVYQARPELLYCSTPESRGQEKYSLQKTLVILGVIAVLTAGGLSLAASSDPDGLEWSIGKVAGVEELEADGGAYESAEAIQEKTALLPDYAFKDSDSALGTSVSGIVGGAVVAALCVAVCQAFRFYRRKK